MCWTAIVGTNLHQLEVYFIEYLLIQKILIFHPDYWEVTDKAFMNCELGGILIQVHFRRYEDSNVSHEYWNLRILKKYFGAGWMSLFSFWQLKVGVRLLRHSLWLGQRQALNIGKTIYRIRDKMQIWQNANITKHQ